MTEENPLDARLVFAVEAATTAGDIARRYFESLSSLKIEVKGPQDLVSEADREVELAIRAAIAERYPDDAIVGEEHPPTEGRSGFVWIIDPIDGTASFLSGIANWCVAIACTHDGVSVVGVVHDPSAGETFSARKGGGAFLNGMRLRTSESKSLGDGTLGVGVSGRHPPARAAAFLSQLLDRGGIFYRNGSGALMLAYVAAGRLIGYCEAHMNAWDCLAGLLLVEEAGGCIVQPDPATVVAEGTVAVAAGPGVFEELKALTDAAGYGR